MDMNAMMQNPQMMAVAQQLMSDPEMMQLMQVLVSVSPTFNFNNGDTTHSVFLRNLTLALLVSS